MVFVIQKSTLTLKSAWIINEKSGGRTPSANANALAGTPEANSRSSTDNSITENAEKSNTPGENSSKNLRKSVLHFQKMLKQRLFTANTLNKDADVNEDLLEELRIYDPSAEVSADGRIIVKGEFVKKST